MKRIELQIQYIGSFYSGWQRQQNSQSVQQTIEEALFKLTGDRLVLHAAGRTDAGVHALDQRAIFDTDSKIPVERFKYALNAYLPDDIRIVRSQEVEADWHPRFNKHLKVYRYTVDTAKIVRPFDFPYVWPFKGQLDLTELQILSESIIGTKDFTNFCASGSSVKNKTRTITSSSWKQEGSKYIFEIVGNGFLYHMVRLLVGTQMQVMRKRLTYEDFLKMLNNPLQGPKANLLAPAKGLCLYRIIYEDT